jgi:hypothetical protein
VDSASSGVTLGLSAYLFSKKELISLASCVERNRLEMPAMVGWIIRPGVAMRLENWGMKRAGTAETWAVRFLFPGLLGRTVWGEAPIPPSEAVVLGVVVQGVTLGAVPSIAG